MEFTVPQFIEKEARIVGPLTFKQFIFVGSAGALCLFLYFFVSLQMFIIMAIFILGMAFSLAFLKIEKIPLPIFIKNMFAFLFKPKIYLWKKKISIPKVIAEIEGIYEEKEEEKSPLTISKKSRIGQLFTRLETKKK
jgi:hypothetical protein